MKISNGSAVSAGTTFGSIGTYDCNKGFTPIGNNTIECDENGNWTAPQVTCKIKGLLFIKEYKVLLYCYILRNQK